jgi:hypothetical protein
MEKKPPQWTVEFDPPFIEIWDEDPRTAFDFWLDENYPYEPDEDSQ